MHELVPGEVWEITVEEPPGGGAIYKLETESGRAMVAWSEIQDAMAQIHALVKAAAETPEEPL